MPDGNPERRRCLQTASQRRFRDRRRLARQRQRQIDQLHETGGDDLAAVLRRKDVGQRNQLTLWHQCDPRDVAGGQEGTRSLHRSSRQRSCRAGKETPGGVGELNEHLAVWARWPTAPKVLRLLFIGGLGQLPPYQDPATTSSSA